MDFINMTSTGKTTIEVDVREFNKMVLYSKKFMLFEYHCCGDVEFYTECVKEIDNENQMEQANNFKG